MTVKIDIGANPSTVINAFSQIQAARKRAQTEAAAFAAIDLSHPELANLEDQIKRITAALEAMRIAAGSTVFGGTGGPRGPVPGSTPGPTAPPPRSPPTTPPGPQAPSANPSPTPVPSPPGPPTPPPLPPRPRRRSGDKDEAGIGSVLSGLLKGPVGFALSLAGLGGIKSMVGAAVGRAQSESVDNDRLLRTLRDGTTDFDTLRDSVRKAAGEVGVTFDRMQAMAQRYATVAGSADMASTVGSARFAASFARGYGLDQMGTVDAFARGDKSGIDPRELGMAVGDVVAGGSLQGRQQEVLEALLRWSQTATRVLVSQNQMTDFAGLYMGMNATLLPGFRGDNAANVINTLNSATMAGGNAGLAGNVFMYRSLAAAGVKDPYAQQMLQAGGIFANAKDYGGHGSVLDAEISELRREYTGRDKNAQYIGFGRFSGLNPLQSKAFLDNYDQISKSHTGGFAGALKSMGIDMTQIKDGSGLADLSDVMLADPRHLDEVRKRVLAGRSGLTAEQQAALQNASGDQLKTLLAQDFARNGMLGNQGTDTQNAQAAFTNVLTTSAALLVTPLNKATEGMTALADAFNRGVALVEKAIATPSNGMGWSGDNDGGGLPGLPPTGGNTGSGLFIPTAFRTGGGGSFGRSGNGGQSLSSDAIRGRAQQAMAYFQSNGWSKEAAAGIVANLIGESGLNEKAIGDGGTAASLMQWHGDRFADVSAGIGQDPRSSFAAGLAGVNWELLHGHDQGMRDVANYLRGHHSAAEKGAYFSLHGERPGNGWGAADQRGDLAEGVMKMPPGASGPAIKGSIAPLKVIHMTKDGRVINTEHLPVTVAPHAQSWNT